MIRACACRTRPSTKRCTVLISERPPEVEDRASTRTSERQCGSSVLDWPLLRNDVDMSNPMKNDPDLRDEYDFSKGERGRYAKRYAEGTNVVLLDPDVAQVFKTAESVNRVLREHLKKTAGSGA